MGKINRNYFTYILSNYKRNVLYIGITDTLVKRVWEHKKELVDGFSKRYKVHYLIYYEVFNDSISAIEREKQLKRWSRKKKIALIGKFNPKLMDLYPTII